MRGLPILILAATLLVAGCSGDRISSPPVIEPDASGSSSSVPSTIVAQEVIPTENTVPPSTGHPPTSTSTTTTMVQQPVADLTVLRPGGLGSVDFGTPADEALEDLSAFLGPPDLVETISPITEGCVEGAGWLDCLRDRRVVDKGRLAVWATYGLEAAMVDTGREVWRQERTPLQFGDWHATVPSSDSRLVTEEGLHPGMTVRDLRSTVPWVEFAYNEGTLDSFYVTLGERGAYWGRLDWNPDSDAIEYWDVSAMQTALNKQGANLAVDGEWGPRCEAAWLQFLTEQGIEPFALAAKWPLWLTPEIGQALGLPPGDITVATLEPRSAAETLASSLAILRPDGLDRFGVGDPANDLVSELVALLGPPSEDTSLTPDGPGPFDFLPLGYWATYELRIVVWEQPDLRIILSDRPYVGDQRGETVPDMLHLISWATTSSRLSLDTGIGVGSTLAELRLAYPHTHVGEYDLQCGNYYGPDWFRTGIDVGELPRGWLDVSGDLDWDWVSEVQSALNERGALLVVDGEYGPKTRAAVRSFQEANWLFANGLMDPETADALELEVPDDARIVRLAAGIPGSC